MKKKTIKTNAIRLLDQAKINYKINEYDGVISATDVANFLNEPTDKVFKTLVTISNDNKYYVFCLPGDHNLDLKKAAKIVGVKKIEMLKSKDLLGLTGYIHGGCSPIGMKKVFPTYIDESALNFDTIFVSGGKIGLQIEINPLDLNKIIKVEFKDIVE